MKNPFEGQMPQDISTGGQRKANPTAAAASLPNPTQRFSDRVDSYVKYRPTYPSAVMNFLRQQGLQSSQVVADVGAGTGISTKLVLENGNPVLAVEPNAAMRAAAERDLATFRGFTAVDGSSEATGLPDASVDWIVAAQAFHWFDPHRARAEFRRILRPGGRVVLLWNARKLGGNPFLEAYEKLLLQYGTDYKDIRHERVTPAMIAEFFAPKPVTSATFPNAQSFDYAGLEGRLRSSSYVPSSDRPQYAPMLAALRQLFDAYNRDDRVAFEYDTEVYVGELL